MFRRKSARSSCSRVSADGDASGIAVRFVGVNSRRSLSQLEPTGRNGAGVNRDPEGLSAQTSQANKAIVTITWITGRRDGLESASEAVDSVDLDSVEDIRVLAFQGNSAAYHLHGKG